MSKFNRSIDFLSSPKRGFFFCSFITDVSPTFSPLLPQVLTISLTMAAITWPYSVCHTRESFHGAAHSIDSPICPCSLMLRLVLSLIFTATKIIWGPPNELVNKFSGVSWLPPVSFFWSFHKLHNNILSIYLWVRLCPVDTKLTKTLNATVHWLMGGEAHM